MRSAALLGVMGVIAGCGSSHSLPVACTEGPGAVVKALAAAPGAVLIDGKNRISDCFKRGASGADEQIVGTNLLAAAQQLGDRGRAGDRAAALQLGYLIGAADRGATDSGVADEMVRRLQAETTLPRSVRSSYERGRRSGLARG